MALENEADLKVLTGGAFKRALLALLPTYEAQSGRKVAVDNDTVGALTKRIEAGETFDVVIVSPSALDALAAAGKVVPGTKTPLAKVGIGVMVRNGAPAPDVGTVETFKQAVLAAKSVAYIDPASGGSSGVYLVKLLERLGLAEAIKDKVKLKRGGHVSDLIESGEAELGIHQISEILPAAGVTLVGPLPAEIQNYTVYAAAVGTAAHDPEAAKALIRSLAGPHAADVLKSKGMLPATA